MSIELLIGMCAFVGLICWLAWSSTKEVKHQEEEVAPEPVKPIVDVKSPVVVPPLPQTLGDLIKEETPKPEKKPRKPRQKKVPPSPEVLKVYQDPKPASTEVLDHRLDGFATPPKKVKDHIEKAAEKKAQKPQPVKAPEAWPFPTSRPDEPPKKVRRARKQKAK